MKYFLFVFTFVFSTIGFSQEESNYMSTEIDVNEFITGTLLTAKDNTNENLAIIIAGSGPTDRDGNQNFLKSNNLKKLAYGLAENNISTFRYDKRIVKQIRKGNVDKNMMFDDFITDAESVMDYFRAKNQFKKIYVIGHSQGSLVGMIAAKNKADGFISLAGAGKSIDKVIIEQVEKTAPMFKEDTERVFNVLIDGKTTKDYPAALASIFNIDLQPFIANWMSYVPTEEIKKLNIPILLINGTKDLQVSENEAIILNEANPKSILKIIPNMNHILVTIEGDNLENSKSYNEPNRKLSQNLIQLISEFINK